MNDIELGVLIPVVQAQWGPGTHPRELMDFAVRAEELGYSSLWVNDFLLTPRIEALTMLAAVAPLTSRVTLGTAALLPVLRRPVQAAQALASIDLLSGGRLVLTVGAAFPGRFGVPQHVLSQVPWERRFTRLDETVAQGRELLAAFAEASYGLRLEQLEQIQALAAGPPEAVAEKLRGYVAAGARHLAVRIAAISLESQREQLEHIITLKGHLRCCRQQRRAEELVTWPSCLVSSREVAVSRASPQLRGYVVLPYRPRPSSTFVA